MDIPLVGGVSRGLIIEMLRHGLELIDSCYLLEWEEYFLDVSQRRLPRLLSDHFPLMLDCGVGSRGSRYFKFENMWLQSEGFVEQVKTWWGSYNYQGFLVMCWHKN
jgi:hypothetical protein